jgi:hypothetical protein
MMANTKYVDNEIDELLMQYNNQEIFNVDDLDIDLIDHDDNNYESHYKEKNHNNSNSNINRSRIITSSSQFSFGNNQNKTTTINQDNSYSTPSTPSHHNDYNSNSNNNNINDYETSSEISVISSNNQFSNHTPEDNKIFKRHYEHNQRLFSLNVLHIHNILNHNNNNNNNNRKVTKDRGNAAVSIALKKKTNTLVSGTFGGKPKISRVKRPGQTRGKLPAWMKHEEEDHEDKEEEKG